MKILLPQSGLSKLAVDESFQLEHDAALSLGFDIFLYDHDQFIKTGVLHTSINFQDVSDTLIMRTWMLKPKQYEHLYDELISRGHVLLNSPAEYVRAHYFGENHASFGENTPKIMYFPNLSKDMFERLFPASVLNNKLEEIKQYFSSESFILKDSVKSEKNIPELFKIPVNISGEDLYSTIIKFIDQRSTLYNDGIMFKEFVNLNVNSENKVNEWRIFVLHHNIISIHQNTGITDAEVPPSNWVLAMSKNVQSNFFTLDVAQKKDGSWIVIETGDGQVSGLSPGQNELEFYSLIKEEFPQTETEKQNENV